MRVKDLRIGQAVAVKPIGGHRRHRSLTRRRAVVTGLPAEPNGKARVWWPDEHDHGLVAISRIAGPWED